MNPSVTFLLLSVFLTSTMFGVFGQPDEKQLKIREAMEAGCYSGFLYGEDGKQAVGNPGQRWPGGVVPYTLAEWDSEDEKLIMEGMNIISSRSCIQFKKRDTEVNYIQIGTGKGCSATLGMANRGKQYVRLSPNCVHTYIIVHELLHALGINHEQCRTDRDEYVQILKDNIEDGKLHNFDIKEGTKTFGLPYDFQSIMHYTANTFAKDETKDTIVSIVAGKQVPRADVKEMSENDIKKLNALYECT